MIYQFKLSHRCDCIGPLNVGDVVVFLSHTDDINKAYRISEAYNRAHLGLNGHCGCQVEVVETKQ